MRVLAKCNLSLAQRYPAQQNRAHYAKVDGLCARPSKSRLAGARRDVASLRGIACSKVATLSAPSHTASSTPRCAPSSHILALSVEHDLDLQGDGDVTQAYPQAD
eukprot:6212153-Pleurochrysis_carterae.AAC.5